MACTGLHGDVCRSPCQESSGTQAQLAAARAPKSPKSPRPGRLEHKAAQLRAELEVHKDALAAAQMEVALLTERLSQSQARAKVRVRAACVRGGWTQRCCPAQRIRPEGLADLLYVLVAAVTWCMAPR